MSLRRRNLGARSEEGSSRISMISQQISSPDPVEMVRQYEHDENLAKLLQAQFNSELTDVSTASITVDSPNVSIELSTSDSCIVLPQSPMDYLSEDDDAPPRDFLGPRDEELHDIDDEEERDEDNSEADDDDDDEGDEVDEDVDDDEVDDEEEVDDDDEEVDDEEEVDDDDDDDDDEEVDDVEDDDEDLNEIGDGDAVDRSRLFPEEIERLPTHISSAPTSSTGGDEDAKMCQICQDSYAKGDELRVLPCFHKFHKSCIDPWLLSSTTCPMCRIKVDLSEGATF